MKFEDLMDKLSIEYRTEGHEHCRPGWIQIDCPFCTKGMSHWRMGYNIAFGHMNCWLCGKYSLFQVVQEYTELSGREVSALIRGLSVQRVQDKEKVVGKYTVPFDLCSLQNEHKKYLIERKFKPSELCKLWNIEGIESANWKYQNRIFIPIHRNGKSVSWTARSIEKEARLRYVSARKEEETYFHKSLLYGEDYARGGIIIHEGPTDVWRTGPGAVCTFGTDYTVAQLEKMAKYPIRVVCFDSLPDAQRKAKQLVAALNVFEGKTYNVLLDAKDPGEASPKETRQLRRLIGA